MEKTIFKNLKDAPHCSIRRFAHKVFNKSIKGSDSAFPFAPTEQFGTMNIRCCDEGPSAVPGIFMLYFNRYIRLCQKSGMPTTARLDACLFIGRQSKLVILRGISIPHFCIEI